MEVNGKNEMKEIPIGLEQLEGEKLMTTSVPLKGSLDAKCTLQVVWSVCVYIHPIMIQIHPVFFFYPLSQIGLFWDSCQNDVVLYGLLPR